MAGLDIWRCRGRGAPAAATSAAGGFGGGEERFRRRAGTDANGMPLVDDSVVMWDPQNQNEILMTHFGFTARNNLPSTLEVLYAQEDYWVFDNIMQIIKATNGESNGSARSRHQADRFRPHWPRHRHGPGGPDHAAGLGRLEPRQTPVGGEVTAAAPAMAAASPDAAASRRPVPGGGEGGMGGMEQTLARDPAEGRYVDDKYQTLPAARLRGALEIHHARRRPVGRGQTNAGADSRRPSISAS